ncbi:hypothetical protein COI44_11780 [Bacillus sp. AFS088145]|nr:hypothetical protein COI44_11780 [Bacillus sp. AFS088145]
MTVMSTAVRRSNEESERLAGSLKKCKKSLGTSQAFFDTLNFKGMGKLSSPIRFQNLSNIATMVLIFAILK